ncbi:MAG: DUF177 domain-containing protein [Oscillospiraceae bacterium]|jgi:uncharacterized protein|nr:DUF177 domain-containing protein [Oscillospiraceae bacterium]
MRLEEVFAKDGATLPINTTFMVEDDPLAFPEPVRVTGEVRGNAGIVTLTLAADTTLHFVCDRCAEEVARPYPVTLQRTLAQTLENEDAEELVFVPDYELDVPEVVREELYLQMPSKLLCREDCQGLCAGCGANLNHGACTCAPEIDPRLAALLPLVDKHDSTP